MKTQKTGKKKQSRKDGPSSPCGDFRKMAEMMKTLHPGEGDAIDCCSVMMKMMGRCKSGEGEGTSKTQNPAGEGERA